MPSSAEFVAAVVRRLVEQPGRVSPRWLEDKKTVELAVAEGDRGKVIGRRGRTIDSLRILASAVFASAGQRVDVKLREE